MISFWKSFFATVFVCLLMCLVFRAGTAILDWLTAIYGYTAVMYGYIGTCIFLYALVVAFVSSHVDSKAKEA